MNAAEWTTYLIERAKSEGVSHTMTAAEVYGWSGGVGADDDRDEVFEAFKESVSESRIGVDQHSNVKAIDKALREYRTTHDNPCGGCGYYDEGEEKPYRVHFCDGASDESFATLAEAIDAASAYADEMDAEQDA